MAACVRLLATGSLPPDVWLLIPLDTGYLFLDDILIGPQLRIIEYRASSIEHPGLPVTHGLILAASDQ